MLRDQARSGSVCVVATRTPVLLRPVGICSSARGADRRGARVGGHVATERSGVPAWTVESSGAVPAVRPPPAVPDGLPAPAPQFAVATGALLTASPGVGWSAVGRRLGGYGVAT
jgi:hypothetical protein